jgi:hypothetical protein
MTIQYTDTVRTAKMEAVRAAIDAGANGLLRIYSGTAPADADTAITGQTLLAELTLADPAGTTSNGVLTFSAITADSSADNGSSTAPTFFRILTSAAVVIFQGSAGVGSGDLNMNGSITAGQNVSVSSLTVTDNND